MRVEERTLRVNVRLAMDMLIVHLRLIQSALSQKVEAKPLGHAQRERSQGRAEMGGREVACLPGEMELPLGWNDERATSSLAKFDPFASSAAGRDVVNAVSSGPTYPVAQATTYHTWKVRFTDEVPRRPAPQGRVSLGYKPDTKGQGHASETGTVSPRPRPKGCQQRQSRGSRLRVSGGTCSERQNLRVPFGPFGSMGQVSPTCNATKWQDRTSSGQWVGLLSNSLLQPKSGHAAVRSR